MAVRCGVTQALASGTTLCLAASLSIGHPLGVPSRELLRHGTPRLHANLARVLIAPNKTFLFPTTHLSSWYILRVRRPRGSNIPIRPGPNIASALRNVLNREVHSV